MTPGNLTEHNSDSAISSQKKRPKFRLKLFFLGIFLVFVIAFVLPKSRLRRSLLPVTEAGEIAPLAMQGGDPYVRALLRTISASESNDPSPYTLLYGGKHFQDLSQHPDLCLPILAGPNVGNCTTAAGRYQFITTTWEEKAPLYHPAPNGMLFWMSYSYEALYQDRVVYNWLTDERAWNINIPERLKAGDIDQVLRTLSGTWTSLGYGLEDNWFTPYLPEIYQELLKEELAIASQ